MKRSILLKMTSLCGTICLFFSFSNVKATNIKKDYMIKNHLNKIKKDYELKKQELYPTFNKILEQFFRLPSNKRKIFDDYYYEFCVYFNRLKGEKKRKNVQFSKQNQIFEYTIDDQDRPKKPLRKAPKRWEVKK